MNCLCVMGVLRVISRRRVVAFRSQREANVLSIVKAMYRFEREDVYITNVPQIRTR